MPLDGSERAEVALPEALSLARALRLPIRLVQAEEPAVAATDSSYPDVAALARTDETTRA